MENRIENLTKVGDISEDDRSRHKGFSEWDSYWSRRDHDTILQVHLLYICIYNIFLVTS